MPNLSLMECAPPVAQKARPQPRFYLKTIVGLMAATRLLLASYVMLHDPQGRVFNEHLFHLVHSLLIGKGLSNPFGGSTGPSAFLAPGYPVIVAIVFRMFGGFSIASADAIMLLQIAASVLTGWLIMRVAERELGAPTANIAGILWAIGLPLLWMPLMLWETSFSTLLLTGLIALALRCKRKPGRAMWLLIGLYCGFTMLLNPSILLAMIAILCWTACQTRSVSRTDPWLGLLVMLVVFAPWPIRNARAFHTFIPLRSNLGFELWQGNRPEGDGFFNFNLDLVHSRSEFEDYAAKGEVAYMREKTALAKASIGTHRWRFVELTAKRFACFWTGVESPSNLLVIAHVSASSLLAFLGLLLLRKSHPDLALLLLLPLLLFPLPYYVTHPDARFREVLDPIALMLGAYALARYDESLKRRQKPAALRSS